MSPARQRALRQLKWQALIGACGLPIMYMVWGGDGSKWPNPLKATK